MMNIKKETELQNLLLNWYRSHQRDLPWRKDKDPYKIWVSEIMLQQTRVDTVIPYYLRFIKKFPTLQQLAGAKEEEVMKAWEGLGYYSRARHLHTAAKEVVNNYGGRVPDDPQKIAALKGIGSYTMGAILSIAFNRKFPAVDGNVLRVISRLYALTDDISRNATRKKFEQIALTMIPEDSPGDFNQALMELGATICTPSSPTCLICPVRKVCKGFSEGLQEELPVKRKARPPKKVPVVLLIVTDGSRILLEKRPQNGLLAGMWGLPTLEQITQEKVADELEKYVALREGTTSYDYEEVGSFEHIFSHRHWRIVVIKVLIKKKEHINITGSEIWFSFQQLAHIGLANVYRKALELYSMKD